MSLLDEYRSKLCRSDQLFFDDFLAMKGGMIISGEEIIAQFELTMYNVDDTFDDQWRLACENLFYISNMYEEDVLKFRRIFGTLQKQTMLEFDRTVWYEFTAVEVEQFFKRVWLTYHGLDEL